MTTGIRFCLSYDPLKWDFIFFKMNIISIGKHIVDTDIVNEATDSCQSVKTCDHTIFITGHYPLNNNDII